MNRKPINGLAHACAGYPQACQQNLWVSGAAHGRHVCAGRDVHRRGVVMRSAAKRWTRRPSPGPRLHHACQSPSDQGFSVAVRRISTSLPTFSVEKSGCARDARDTRECHALPRCVRALTQCRCRPRRLSGTGAGSRRRTADRPTALATNPGCVKAARNAAIDSRIAQYGRLHYMGEHVGASSIRRYRRRARRGPNPTQAGRLSERPSILLRVEARKHPRNLDRPASRTDRRREMRRRRGGA